MANQYLILLFAITTGRKVGTSLWIVNRCYQRLCGFRKISWLFRKVLWTAMRATLMSGFCVYLTESGLFRHNSGVDYIRILWFDGIVEYIMTLFTHCLCIRLMNAPLALHNLSQTTEIAVIASKTHGLCFMPDKNEKMIKAFTKNWHLPFPIFSYRTIWMLE